ncbi:hypothetical protein WEI85_22105 [Actinomycetes bacterium KLBMP 9797]
MEPDKTEAAALLRPLEREPRTPPAIDIGKAIADGTRRQRTHRVAGAGATALATVAAVAGGWALFAPDPAPGGGPAPDIAAASASGEPGPTPPTACTLQQLEMPQGQPPMSVVTGGDPSGRYVVGRSYPDSSQTPRILIWENGKVTAVAMEGQDQALRDVNSAGAAVGYSFVGDDEALRTAAWVYRDGKMSRLAGDNAEAHAINEDGVIVGVVDGKPALWRTPTSEPTLLKTPGAGWIGQATDIDDDGTVVGRLAKGETEAEAGYLWRPGGALEKLPVPAVDGKQATEYTASSIRNGWVAGWALLGERSSGKRDAAAGKPAGGGEIRAPRWNLRTGAVDTPDGIRMVEGINRHGWVVGEASGPVLLADGRTVQLPTLGHDDTIPSIVYTVSDDGRTLAGQVWMADGDPAAALWRCS